ncbi:hypothetical protein BJX62DRAFT_69099 [Aspergillus germanicus]
MESLSADAFRQIIQTFLDEVDFDVHFDHWRYNVVDEASSILKKLPDWNVEWDSSIIVAYEAVRLMIPHLCDDAQTQIIIKDTVGLVIDDKPSLFVPGIRFSSGQLIKTLRLWDFHRSRPSPRVVRTIHRLDHLALVVPMDDLHPLRDARDRVARCCRPQRILHLLHEAPGDGCGFKSCVVLNRGCDAKEFVYLLPDMTAFVIELNDFLSFYEESIVGDDVYIVVIQRQRLQHQSFEWVIRESRDACVAIMKRLCSAPVSPQMRESVRQFVAGYVKFYLEVTRYRFKELLPVGTRDRVTCSPPLRLL